MGKKVLICKKLAELSTLSSPQAEVLSKNKRKEKELVWGQGSRGEEGDIPTGIALVSQLDPA